VLIGLGFLLEGLLPVFWAVMAAQLLWGIGYTFTSGATQAWLSDEIGEVAANAHMLRVSVWSRYTSFVALPSAFLLSYSGLQIPILVGAVGFLLLAAVLALTMPETGFKPHPSAREGGVIVGFKTTLLEALKFARANQQIRLIFLITIIFGAASESFDRLWQVHILSFGLPKLEFAGLSAAQNLLIWFIGIDMAIQLLGLPFSSLIAKTDTADTRAIARRLLWVTAALGASIGLFALAGSLWWVVAAYVLARIARGLHEPLSSAWLNQRLEPSTRATVLSLNGQADAVGQIAGGPMVGALGNISLRLALAVGAGILAACLPLYQRATKARELG
jgi:MFS transporter, DHA3 family, tetracycline resistance protein